MSRRIVATCFSALAMGAGLYGCSFNPAVTTGGNGVDAGAGAGGAGGAPAVDARPDRPAPPQPPNTDDINRVDVNCAATSATPTLVREPVDVIVVIDNSQSMTNEIQAVERNIGVSFAQILEASAVDYRVILLARHGSAVSQQSICIRASSTRSSAA